MLISPFSANAPKSHELRSTGERLPRAPMARTIATGPVAAKMNATSALTACRPLRSASTRRREGVDAPAGSGGVEPRAGKNGTRRIVHGTKPRRNPHLP